MNESTSKAKGAGTRRRRNILRAMRNASREAWQLDDKLRQLCVTQARETLENKNANIRDRQNAATFVLKLSEVNLDRAMLMAEMGSLLGDEDRQDDAIAVVTNKNFFGNDAHEAAESADQDPSEETSAEANHRGSVAAAPSTADPT